MSVEPIRWLDLPQDSPPWRPGVRDEWAAAVVDELLESDYPHEFLAALFFDPIPLAALAGAGFLLMSQDMGGIPILLPKLHLERAVLAPCDFRVPKGLRGKLDAGKTGLLLHVSNNIGEAFDICVKRWGADWLTPPLKEALEGFPRDAENGGLPSARPLSFCLYRGGKLAAVEFGIAVGGVYTSYSGTWIEGGAGSMQMAMTAVWLAENGFELWDLGMPMDYKARLGAEYFDRRTFVARFRAARGAKT